MSHRDAYILLSLVALLWAGNFPASKIGLTELSPITLTMARAVLVTPVLLLLARLLEGPLPTLKRRDHKTFIVLSLTGLVCNTTVWFYGMKYTSPINAGILGAAAPVVVAVAGSLWLGDRMSRASVVGIALTVAAVVLTISRGSIRTLLALSFNHGDLLILTSQVGWVIYTLYSRATKTQLGPVTIMAGSHVVSCALLLPMALIVDGGFPLARAGWAGWGVVLYGAFPVTLGHLWYYKCIRSVGAGRAAVFSNLIPFLVIGLSWGILGEPIRWYHAVGATVVIAGVILTTRR